MLRTAQSLPQEWAFDTGLRPRPFPDEAASLLPGPLAATRTGLTPASDDELTTQDQPPTRSTSCLLGARKGLTTSDGPARPRPAAVGRCPHRSARPSTWSGGSDQGRHGGKHPGIGEPPGGGPDRRPAPTPPPSRAGATARRSAGANIVLPVPGGPTSSTWVPATAISQACRASSCPTTSARSAGGASANRRQPRAGPPQLLLPGEPAQHLGEAGRSIPGC